MEEELKLREEKRLEEMRLREEERQRFGFFYFLAAIVDRYLKNHLINIFVTNKHLSKI